MGDTVNINNSTPYDDIAPSETELWGSMWSGYAEPNIDNEDTNEDGDNGVDPEAHQAEKAKYTGTGFNGGWAKMTHWYKEHPNEINDIMFNGAEHDAEWYQQDPKRIGDLVRDYLAYQKSKADDKNDQNDSAEADLTVDKIKQKFLEDHEKALQAAEQELDALRPDLAELYAKSRSLFFGRERGKYRANFEEIKHKYKEKLNNFLKLKSEKISTEEFDHELGAFLETRIAEARADIDAKIAAFTSGDPNNPIAKTQEEIDAEKARLIKEADDAIREEIYDKSKDYQTKKNVDFLEDYLDQATKLEKATTDAIDGEGVKGAKGVYRKFVHKIINNKPLRIALTGAAAVGLAATVWGVAAGAVAVTANYTLGGVAVGAAKGAIGGFVGSRQDSKTSEVRGFVSEEQIKEQLESIKNTGQSTDVVTDWVLGQYYDANRTDHKRGLIKTGIAVFGGGLAGGSMAGVSIKQAQPGTREHHGWSLSHKNEPLEVHATKNIDNVNVEKGKGLFEVFRQMGGDKQYQSKALEISQPITEKYSAQGAGGLADVFEGKVIDWPPISRSYITELSEAWAQAGIIDTTETGGITPILNPIIREKSITTYVSSGIFNLLTRHVAPAVGGAIVGGTTNNSFQSRANLSLNEEDRNRKSFLSRGTNTLAAVREKKAIANENKAVNGLLDAFSNTLSEKDQKYILQYIQNPDVISVSTSSDAQEFIDSLNLYPSDIKDRIIDGILGFYGVRQDYFQHPSFDPVTGQIIQTTAPNHNDTIGNAA